VIALAAGSIATQGWAMDGFAEHRHLAVGICADSASPAAAMQRVSLFGRSGPRRTSVAQPDTSARCVICHDGMIASDIGFSDLEGGAGHYRGGMSGGHSLDVRYDPSHSRSRLRPLDAMVDGTDLTVRDLLTDDRRVSCESCHSVCASSEEGSLRFPRATLCLTCHDM
jgi:predicted CXXCH cytochrome family protein